MKKELQDRKREIKNRLLFAPLALSHTLSHTLEHYVDV